MHNVEAISNQLKKHGYRQTKIRTAIISLFVKNKKPLTYFDIQRLLSKKRISANKATVYRELAFLKENNIVKELQFSGDTKYYELSISSNHHHHVVCTKCDRIEDFKGCNYKKIAKDAIKQVSSFSKIDEHTFELFGICKNCKK